MRCDTGRCRDSRQDGRSVTNAGAQGKPQPDARGGRELQGEAAQARASDRKITAGGKEGPGDRRVHFTLAFVTARLRWSHGNGRTRTERAKGVYHHKARRGGPGDAEPGGDILVDCFHPAPVSTEKGLPFPVMITLSARVSPGLHLSPHAGRDGRASGGPGRQENAECQSSRQRLRFPPASH